MCMCTTGWFQLEEGDMVWVRDLDGTKKPEDDVIRFYYLSSCVCVFNCYIY